MLFGLLGLLVFGIYKLFVEGVPSAIVVAAFTLTGGLLAQTVGNSFQRKREIESNLRDRKITVYEQFMVFWFDTLLNPVKRKAIHGALELPDEQEAAKKLHEFTREVILWGSDDVVKAYSEWRRLIAKRHEGNASYETLQYLERTIFAIRKDLGYQNRGLRKNDILALFINDIDQMEAPPGGRSERPSGPA